MWWGEVGPPADRVATVAVLASADTTAISSDPGGGVNDAVVIVAATNVQAVTGLLASSVMAPDGTISSSAQRPALEGAPAPTAVAPGVPGPLADRHEPHT